TLAAEGGAARGVDGGLQAHCSTPTGAGSASGIAHSSNLAWRMARARFSISMESGRSSPSGGAMARTASRTRRNSGPGSKGSRYRRASAAASSSMAAMYSPFSTMVRSLRAAVMPMETWSSWPPEVGTLSTLAGWASTLHSLSSETAATWPIMKPLPRPGWAARKAGSPWLRSGLTRRSMRRSAMPARVVRAMAAVSKARASGAPWKLPPESTAAGFNFDGVGGEAECAAHRAVHLRHAAQAVGVLHAGGGGAAGGGDIARFQERAQAGGNDALSGMRARGVDALVEGDGRAEQGFEGH